MGDFVISVMRCEGIRGKKYVQKHAQVTCVRHRERLTMEMDGGGEIERN
jgi:hypothetical protein